MKRLFLIVCFLTLTSVCCEAQFISAEKKIGGYEFYQDGQRVKLKELVRIIDTNDEARSLMKMAQSEKVISSIIGYGGGFMMGYSLGSWVNRGELRWSVLGVGAGLALVSIPVSRGAYDKALRAVGIYDDALESSVFRKKKPELGLIVSGNGIGVAIAF